MSKFSNLRLATLALAGLGAVASGSVFADGMTVDSNGGLEVFETGGSEKYWFKIGGRLIFDTVMFDAGESEHSKFPSGSNIRHARLSLKGGVGSNWVYKVDFDHFPASDRITSNFGRTSIGEAFMAYNGCKNIWVALGQIAVPFSLEGWGNQTEQTFMENSLPVNAFGPNYGLGLYAEWHNDMFTAAGAVYHPRAGTRQTGDVISTDPSSNLPVGVGVPGAGPNGSDTGSDPFGFGGRATFSPVHDDYTVYHVGLSYRHQNLHDNANNHNFVTVPEVFTRQAPRLFTNIPPNSSKSYSVGGGELAARYGSFMAAAEYVRAHVDRDGVFPLANDPRNPGDTLRLDGYSVMMSYVLTGEVKEYDFASGTFGRVHPKSSKGAWEVAARHSYVKLVDIQEMRQLPVPWTAPNVIAPGFGNNNNGGIHPNNIYGSVNDFVGNAHSTTLGVNWWVNQNVRFMANYVRMSFPNTFGNNGPTDVDVNAFGLRALVNW